MIKDTNTFKYESVIQPELNLLKLYLINPYFITAADPDYIEKRERFSKINNVNRYILNPGLVLRKLISRSLSLFILVSFGPMISVFETERLQKGFAISNVLAIEVSYILKGFEFDIRPNLRHVSNAGLKSEYWL